jgi:site-specific DNA recombinase
MADTTRAVAYYRMSTDRQEASIPRQRDSVQAYAAVHNFEIVREYTDIGISGDATEKRAEFQRMRADGARGDFAAILCWDKDRFGRFDSIEQGYWVKPLRDAGVRLVTVTQGVIDWNSFGGRIVDAALAESKHEFLRSLGHNTAAGKVRNAKLNYFNGGTVPYGFDRMLLNEKDEPAQRLLRGERVAKPHGWHTVLVPVEDIDEIETVRWVFRSFADRDLSCRGLANEMNARGIPGPGSAEKRRKTPWGRQTILLMLANENYIGHSVYGRVNLEKFCRVRNGEAVPVAGIPKTKGGNPKKQVNKEGFIVNPNCHEGIIDRDLWDRVQAKLNARRQEKQYPRKTGYPLAGLVVCGHCGKRMHGCTNHCKNRSGRKAYRRYVCSSYNLNGSSSCGYHAIREEILLPFLCRKLRTDYLTPAKLEQLKKELRAQAAASRQSDPLKIERLRARLVQLDADVLKSAKNVLRAGNNLDLLNAALTDLRNEREQLARDLDAAERAAGASPTDIDGRIAAAIDALRDLQERLDAASPDQIREVLRQMVTKVELFFESVPKRKKTFHKVVRGVVRLRPQQDVTSIKERQACGRTRTSTISTACPRCSIASPSAR